MPVTSISKSDNMAALALRGLEKSSSAMGQVMQRLSSGKRINRASDDSSGLSKASKMHAQTLGLNMSVRHANSGINILQTMEGSLSDQHNILRRMRELAVQSASDTNTGTDRTFIQDEINQLNSELNKIVIFDKPINYKEPYFEESIYIAPTEIPDKTQSNFLV